MVGSSIAGLGSEIKTESRWLQLILENLLVFILIITLTLTVLGVWITRSASDALIAALIGFIALVSCVMLNALYFEPRKEREASALKAIEEKKKAAELKAQLLDAIYSEMGRVYGETKGNVQFLKTNIKKSLRSTGYELNEQGIVPSKLYKDTTVHWNKPIENYFDLYDSVRIGNPSLFYQLQDAKGIDSFYSLLKDVLVGISDYEKTVERTINDIEFAFFLIELDLWLGAFELDLQLLRDCTPGPFTHHANELINRVNALLPIKILKERRANPRVIHYFASHDFESTVHGLSHKRKDFDLEKFMEAFNGSLQRNGCTLVDAIVKGLEASIEAAWRLNTPLEPRDLLVVKLASMWRDQLPLQYTIFDQEEKWLNSATLNVRYSTVNKTTNEREMLDTTYWHFASIDDATNYVDQLDKTGCYAYNIDTAETTLFEVVTGKAPTAFKHYTKIRDVDDRGGWIIQNDDIVTVTCVTPL